VFWLAAFFGILICALAALAFIYHVAVSIRSGSAVGLGWTFNRADKPAQYWTQITSAILFGAYFLLLIAGAIASLGRAHGWFRWSG
jgi:TRAP-type C4-dicarboxylate transport system permease small subunit